MTDHLTENMPDVHPAASSPHQPSRRPFGCGRLALFGLVAFFVIGILCVCSLVAAVFLFAVASEVFNEFSNEIQEKTITERVIDGNAQAEDIVAVVSIDGIITSDADGFIARQIRRVLADTNVKAVVLRIDSPGGTMSGSDYYLHLLKKMKSERKIPVIVSMGSMATSGGYYVSMAGDEIFAEPSTITGSIGVIASLFDASDFFDKIGVKPTPIISGDHKTMGSFMRPMTDEEHVLWQDLIDDNFARFKRVIQEGRQKFRDDPEALDKLATGRVMTSGEAFSLGLIDGLGYLDDAVAHSVRLANLPERSYKVIRYRPRPSFMEAVLEGRAQNPLLGVKAVAELSTPTIYLICPHVVPWVP